MLRLRFLQRHLPPSLLSELQLPGMNKNTKTKKSHTRMWSVMVMTIYANRHTQQSFTARGERISINNFVRQFRNSFQHPQP
mmetsp:Transcript_24262/g.52333  ORF Transcript_24262/g.52333 Transcript_24262/m.52333 type:complete len:81 (-) Transcript_24262:335-577(-)